MISIRQLLRECEPRCCWCNTVLTPSTATREHIIPKARGGCDAWWNLAPACLACNQDRSDALMPPSRLQGVGRGWASKRWARCKSIEDVLELRKERSAWASAWRGTHKPKSPRSLLIQEQAPLSLDVQQRLEDARALHRRRAAAALREELTPEADLSPSMRRRLGRVSKEVS